jgi:lysozyme
MTWTHVDFDVAMEVAAHEALVRQTYLDSVDVNTWCVGMTNATGHHVERYIGRPASLQHCMNVYAWALNRYAEGVRRAFKGVSLTKAQFAAALSFHWNTGAIERASWVKSFKAGNIAAARKAFMNWVTPKEITARRQKERDLFFDGKWTNNGTMLEFTRLTARRTPDRGSGKVVNVERELRQAIVGITAPILDAAPKPDNKPAAPTLSPPSAPGNSGAPVPAQPSPAPSPAPTPSTPATGGFWAALASFVRNLFSRG